MKLTELLIEICIFTLVFICVMESYTLFNKNETKINTKIEQVELVLQTDSKIRSEIKNMKINYWENPDKRINYFKNQLINMQLDENCRIINVETITNSNKKASGLSVSWECNKKKIITKESFSFKVINE